MCVLVVSVIYFENKESANVIKGSHGVIAIFSLQNK